MIRKIKKSNEEWGKQLTPEQYRVTRMKGTEPPFTGEYYDHEEKGIYRCICCDTPLFDSETKFDSGSGWPSFWSPITDENLETQPDHSMDMERTEVVCTVCGAHLGHVFDDGPAPTRKRFCVNSVSIQFSKD